MYELRLHLSHKILWKFRKGNNGAATEKHVCDVFGEGAISGGAVRKWFIKFRTGYTSLKDDEGSVRSSDIDVDAFNILVEPNALLTVPKLIDMLNISILTIHRLFKKLAKVNKLFVLNKHN